MPDVLTTPQGRLLAYDRTSGNGPGVIFLGGFKSDMTGTKALHLHDWARATGRAFLRFDYSGHGASSGAFLDGCISDWAQDAAHMLAQTTGPQILVGSSMGGWIALLLARRFPGRIAGLVGIAPAPDFTDRMWQGFTPAQKATIEATGRYEEASDYSPEPYVFTRHLLTDGQNNLVLQKPLPLPFPVRLLQGTADTDVPPAVALSLLDHATSPDIRLTLVKGADHRFSTPQCLGLIVQAVTNIAER
ncbi:MAG: alpha/beta hydrolase [Pseudomonadota bacterium]